MRRLREGAKINMALEQMGVVKLQYGKEHVMDTSLLYPLKLAGHRILFLGTRSQKRGRDQGSGENLGVLKEPRNSVLHVRCKAMMFSIKTSWRSGTIIQLK